MRAGRALDVGLIAGTLTGVLSSVLPGTALACAVALGSCTVFATGPLTRRVLIAMAAVALMTAHGARARDGALASPLRAWAETAGTASSTPIRVEGVFVRDAEPTDTGARLIVDVEDVGALEGDQGRRFRGRIQAHVSGQFVGESIPAWVAGRRISAPMLLRLPQVWRNPGGASEPWQTLTRTFDLTATIKSAALITAEPGRPWDEAAAYIRAFVRRQTHRLYAPLSPTTEGVVNAILIGDRSGMAPDIEERLQAAGTYHVVAISGGNVTLVTVWIFLLFRLVVRPHVPAVLGTMAVLLAYGWIVGADPSVVRAVMAALVYLVCGLKGLRPLPPDVLGLVAVTVAAVDPMSVIDVGVWLSFGATLGIMLLVPRLMAGGGQTIEVDRSRRPGKLRVALLGLLTATVSAELVLLPVSACVFSRVGIAGLVLNFVAIPTMTIVQMAGATSVALWWCPVLAHAAAILAHVSSACLVESARLVDVAPWLTWRVPPSPLVIVGAFYAALGWCLWWHGGRTGRRAGFAALAITAALMLWPPWTWWVRPTSGRLRLTMVDVGQGESILVQFPTGQALVIDAGGRSAQFDVGRRVVTPAMWASGVRHLDWMAVTHADLDHIGGARALDGTFLPVEVWEGVPVPSDANRRALREGVFARGAVWRELRRGDRFEVGAVHVEVLNPTVPDWERPRPRNPDSIVLLLTYRDVQCLLTGDLDEATERELAFDRRARLRILKVGHHGSRTSTSPDLLDHFAPQLALVSAGRANPFGHPSPEVLGRLADAGVELFRTDRDGAIIVETDGREIGVRSMSGRTWTLSVVNLGL